RFFAKGEVRIGGGVAGGIGGGLRPPRPRLERGLPLSPVTRQQPGHPALGQAVSTGYLALRPALGDNSSDDKACLRHPPTVTARAFLCPKTRPAITGPDPPGPGTSQQTARPALASAAATGYTIGTRPTATSMTAERVSPGIHRP